MVDVKAFVKEMAEATRAMVAKELQSVLSRVDDLDRRLKELPTPKDGKDADPEALAVAVLECVNKALAGVPQPKDGRDGINGADGKDGAPGEPGPPGKDGIDGRDGTPGERGSAGEKGLDGKDGANGIDGKSVSIKDIADLVRLQVEKAVAAIPKALDGRNGIDGKSGEPGRDAPHIEIIPAIDLSREYPRGTFAKHANGLWRSFETTAGLKGWDCIVEGLAEVRYVQSDEERQFAVEHVLSSGKTFTKGVHLPAMVYQGVFKDGQAYKRGDTVTWGGSLWHCDEPTSDKPGDGKSWTLCAKKGRDGQDGQAGKPGEKGADGRRG